MSLQIASTAFTEGQPIPQKYTCQGSDVSPQLKWSGAPPNTKSFALIADHPDALADLGDVVLRDLVFDSGRKQDINILLDPGIAGENFVSELFGFP